MRLWTVKLESQQHVSSECTSLQEFLATLVARAGPTTTAAVTGTKTEVDVLGSLPKDIYGEPAKPCPDEQDIPIDTGNMQDVTHIAPWQEDVNLPVATASEEVQAMLAKLGQNGGIWKLVGKVALLWGGICGAMSMTDKFISFLHIARCPLIPRILGFVFMVLLPWSPVVIPLLPSLIQSWATRSPFKIAELACIAGVYVSIMIMITLWGKRISKYDDPLKQYGMI
ncbi:CAAX amino terminal protease [Olea europaea subsp. europaea]|uniref:CAAX amino terminal protease n=1 Tax=Olea europaea subsp. europaea TaxID=158383 RepID=A0A8S0U1X0_OLEEU|nr:CAAX amino terminal protease [Olea europaea subsp. europaea]